MTTKTHLVPVSIQDGYGYHMSDNGFLFGTAKFDGKDWVAMPYENGYADRNMAMTFRRLEAAETYLLALLYDKQ